MIERWQIEGIEGWREWIEKIPDINFPSDWSVRIIPPYAGALVRFIAFKNNKRISVYLDVNNTLGYMDGPYWEAYPINGDTSRFMLNDVENLISAIDQEFTPEPPQDNNGKEM